jgi:hypothetical protein
LRVIHRFAYQAGAGRVDETTGSVVWGRAATTTAGTIMIGTNCAGTFKGNIKPPGFDPGAFAISGSIHCILE